MALVHVIVQSDLLQILLRNCMAQKPACENQPELVLDSFPVPYKDIEKQAEKGGQPFDNSVSVPRLCQGIEQQARKGV